MRLLRDFLCLVHESTLMSEVMRISFVTDHPLLSCSLFSFDSQINSNMTNRGGVSQLDTAVYPCALSYLIFSQTSRLTGSNPAVQLELRTVWKYCVQPRPSSVSSACFLSLSPAELIMRSTCCLLLHQHHKWFSLSNAARGFFKMDIYLNWWMFVHLPGTVCVYLDDQTDDLLFEPNESDSHKIASSCSCSFSAPP